MSLEHDKRQPGATPHVCYVQVAQEAAKSRVEAQRQAVAPSKATPPPAKPPVQASLSQAGRSMSGITDSASLEDEKGVVGNIDTVEMSRDIDELVAPRGALGGAGCEPPVVVEHTSSMIKSHRHNRQMKSYHGTDGLHCYSFAGCRVPSCRLQWIHVPIAGCRVPSCQLQSDPCAKAVQGMNAVELRITRTHTYASAQMMKGSRWSDRGRRTASMAAILQFGRPL